MKTETREPLTRETAVWTGKPLVLAAVLFVAVNLRAPITSVGPVIESIKESLGLTGSAAGMITTLPLLAFAVVSPLAARLGNRWGAEIVLFAGMIALAAGIVVRSLSGAAALFAGTAAIGTAIAACNVLVPSYLKERFPDKLGLMTGLYTVMMNLTGAVASGISHPLAEQAGFGWQGTLAVWALTAVMAVAALLPLLRRGAGSTRKAARAGGSRLWRSGLAWQVSLFMGFQSLLFYINISWIPEMLHDGGMSSERAGLMLSLLQLVSLPTTFLIPVWAGRRKSQRSVVAISAALYLIGYLGLLFGHIRLAPVWIVLIGVAAGASFSLAVMLFALRTRTSGEAAELSGMAQSVGYALAAAGPALFGWLHDLTQGWTVPLTFQAAMLVFFLLFGLSAGSGKFVGTGNR